MVRNANIHVSPSATITPITLRSLAFVVVFVDFLRSEVVFSINLRETRRKTIVLKTITKVTGPRNAI